MNEKKITQLKKLNNLNALLLREHGLSTSEYLLLLETIKKNFVVKLVHASFSEFIGGTMNMMTIIERTHYLIDSVETKKQSEKVFDTTERRGLGWAYPSTDESIDVDA